MKIIKNHTTNKIEDVLIIPFLEFIYGTNEKDIAFSAIPESNGKRPDYYINSTNTLIEVKEIHDRLSNQKHAQWGTIAQKLQKSTDSNKLLNNIKGTYLVNTPAVFKLYKFEEVASKIIQEIINGLDKKKNINIFGIDFEINKVSNEGGVVVYGSTGGASSINPAEIVYQNIKDKVATANNQLGNSPNNINPKKRILLLVNKYYFPLWDWDLFKAISMIYSDLLNYHNVDEIWYQIGTKEKGTTHKLLYRKSFFDQFEKKKIISVEKEDYEMYASWFSALSDLGDDKKDKLISALKTFLNKNKPNVIFPSDGNREQMVRFGLWLLEKNRINDAIWLINQFIDDPDPTEPGHYEGNPTFNYDQNIRDGKGTIAITTVMGHLAWVVKDLARKSERHITKNLIKSFDYTEKILTEKKNLYVIQQWIVPLVEIANRRLWLAEEDIKTYLRFRNLVLDKKKGLIVNYFQYPEIARFLINLLDFFKDLTTNEANFVLNHLMKTEEGYRLLVYYALYRERHYKKDSEVALIIKKVNTEIFNYKPHFALKLLKEITLDKKKQYSKLRSHIAWQFWRLLDDLPKEFCFLSEWVDNLFDSPYEKQTFSNLFHLLEEWYGKKTECENPSHSWLMSYIKKMSEYATDEIKGRNTWTSMEQIINKVAELYPQDLSFILQKLTEIWMVGAYIGDINVIYTSYQKIKDPKLRQDVSKLSQKLHKKLQEVNPKVINIDWDKISI